MWACGLPYRISPKSENLRFPPCVLSAKTAVGSRPPHTDQGKNQEKTMAMKYALLQHQGLTCFSWFLSNSRDRADVPGIFVQASAEPNDCVKPNEQNRVYSNFAMASNRTFKNLFGLCRVQPKISKKWHYATGHAPNIHPSLH